MARERPSTFRVVWIPNSSRNDLNRYEIPEWFVRYILAWSGKTYSSVPEWVCCSVKKSANGGRIGISSNAPVFRRFRVIQPSWISDHFNRQISPSDRPVQIPIIKIGRTKLLRWLPISRNSSGVNASRLSGIAFCKGRSNGLFSKPASSFNHVNTLLHCFRYWFNVVGERQSRDT